MATTEIAFQTRGRRLGRLRSYWPLAPALPAIGLMVLWAEHDGGYDLDTWYWGALVLLALLAATVIALGAGRVRLPRSGAVALAGLSAYTAWSYASIAWAQNPGLALQGSNRTLLYLVLFTLLLILPWTPQTALGALVLYALGVGALGVVLLARLSAGDGVQELVVQGRLLAPTGYFNSTAALFMIEALLGLALAIRRELPALLRGTLVALSCVALQLCVLCQSRGWLFTLPLVCLAAVAVVRGRIRFAVGAVIPVAAVLIDLHLLSEVYPAHGGPGLVQAAGRAGTAGLVSCAAAFVVGTAAGWVETRLRPPRLSRAVQVWLGATIAVIALAGAGAGVIRVTHGHPVAFVSRQWRDFARPQTPQSRGSHFTAVGSGRYDVWRVSLDAIRAHPLEGIGQDNFGDYYITRRHTDEEPSSPHSFEFSLLAETGIIGFAFFAIFAIAAVVGALRGRRTGSELSRSVAGAALLALLVWLIHGSVDWFWEMPAISGPALGFLGMAAGLLPPPERAVAPAPRAAEPRGASPPASGGRRRVPAPVGYVAAAAALLAAVVVLGLPYLSVRKTSLATDVAAHNPAAALADLAAAAELNPLSSTPGRLAGVVALDAGLYSTAERRFAQSIAREPGGWFSWLGAGLAPSALGRRTVATRDLRTAYAINDRQPAIRVALSRIRTAHPLTSAEALKLLIVR